MEQIKPILGIIAAVLAFIAYAPYIRDIFRNKTKPHIFSWFLWGILTGIIAALQITGGSAWGALTTFSICIISFFIATVSLRNGKKQIKKVDIIFLVLGLLAIPLWLLSNQPVLSIILLMIIDMLAFAPTIRKSWSAPYTETLSTYLIVTFRHVLALLAISNYNIVTYLFPATWIVANILFASMLIIRRKQLNNANAV